MHADKDEKEKNRAKQNFQKVQQAYDTLSDPEKKQMYDQFGEGYEQMGRGGGNPFGGGGAGGGAGPGGFGDFDFSQIFGGGGGRGRGGGGGGFEDILRQMGGGGGRRGAPPQQQAPTKGSDFEQEITIPFAVAVLGGKHQVRLSRGSGKVDSIDVTIPIGIEQLQKIRLRGQGHPSAGGGPRGDLIIKVKIAAHPNYSRNGLNLNVSVPITLLEAAEGAKVELPTPHGRVSLSVPAGCSSGKSLRLKGMGIRGKDRSGDLIATLQLVVPDEIVPQDIEAIKSLSESWDNPMRDELTW